MIQKTRAPGNIPKRFPGPSLQNTGARNTRSKWGPMTNNKRRCLACLPTMKSVAWHGVAYSGARRRLVSSTIRDESVRGGPGPAPNTGPAPPSQPQRHVLRSIGRPSGRKTHRRVRLAHASGERNRFGAPSTWRRANVFLSFPRGPTSHWALSLTLSPFYFHLCPSATRDRATRYS